MSGEIGVPFVLQLKDGVNAIQLTDFEGLAQTVEDTHLLHYLANGSSYLEEVEQQMCMQPMTQIIDNNLQVMNNSVQIVDKNVRVIDSQGHILDRSSQILNSGFQIVDTTNQVDKNIHILNNNKTIVDNNIQIVENCQTLNKKLKVVDNPIEPKAITEKGNNSKNPKDGLNIVFEVVYPEQLNLKFQGLKRGRPKKAKTEEPPEETVTQKPVTTKPSKPIAKPSKPAPKTRSGRVVRFPKHIEKDFKNIELEETVSENGQMVIQTTDFEQYEEEPPSKPPETIEKTIPKQLKHTKRTIAAQYKCPKCQAVYLGKTKLIQHIKRYPDHGPLPIARNENNFDVWNYLVDITQKCPPAQRGQKFCGELTNLLHNVLLLTSALFKEVEANKSYVEVDKVLGNAIGLPPGQYKFNDSELYKDVTVFKLITNTDFFKSVSLSKENDKTTKKASNVEDSTSKDNIKEIKDGTEAEQKEKAKRVCDIEVKSNNTDIDMLYFNGTDKNTEKDAFPAVSESNTKPMENPCDKETEISNIPDEFTKKPLAEPLDDRISVPQELLSENSLLHLPNLRTAVDDLMLTTVDTGSTLLDNSTSSDEVMNVDQFVNERFKKITEPDLDILGASLNLDLPPLDLFQFHTS